MFNFLRRWFGRKKPELPAPIRPDQVDHEDPIAREVIARAFNTGKIVIGNVDDQGNFKIEELDREGNHD